MECLYFTDGIISDKKTLTNLCIYFDKVYTFFLSPDYFLKALEEKWCKETPVLKKSAFEDTLLSKIYLEEYKEFVKSNDELINYKVLQPTFIEKTPPDLIKIESKKDLFKALFATPILQNREKWNQWGQSLGMIPTDKKHYDGALFSLYRWQTVSSALYFAIQKGLIPISDDKILTNLAYLTISKSDFNSRPSIDEITAAQKAFKKMSSLPDFPVLSSNEILRVRDIFSKELNSFRNYIFKNNDIPPRLKEFESEIKSLKGKRGWKIISDVACGINAILLSNSLTLPSLTTISMSSPFFLKILIDIYEYRLDLKSIKKKNEGLVFLYEIKRKYGKK